MTLPNLQKLTEQATPGKWEYDGDGNVTTPYQEPVAETAVLGDAHLIAAAPDMAALLIECAEFIDVVGAYLASENAHGAATSRAEEIRARLADFDGRIQ